MFQFSSGSKNEVRTQTSGGFYPQFPRVVWSPKPSRTTLYRVLFMVIEHFKPGALQQIGERFQQKGRMMPDGVTYHASWVDLTGARCFQVMESPQRDLLDLWMSHWSDLVDFEVTPVLTSSEFWAARQSGRADGRQLP